jgi:nitronate monooxygenase/enoyl-[acyl-carrier protein] reductase II
MLRTRLCDLLGIDLPIILAGMGAGATSAEFAAAVSNEGGLGSVGSLFRSADTVKRDIDLLPTLTNRNFAINHIPQTLDVESFQHTLLARPAVISFALDDPGDLIRQAHDVGSRVMLQVTTVAQAIQAAEHGVDVIIVQGTEAGGYGGTISTMALVPQVVDAVSPVPVVAAGGIYDGRGIAAALMLGAVGVNMGTRFLASEESPIDDDWKQAIIEARSEDAVKAEVINDIIPVPGTVGYGTVGRTLRTPFLDEWGMKRDELVVMAHVFGRKSARDFGGDSARNTGMGGPDCRRRARDPDCRRNHAATGRSDRSGVGPGSRTAVNGVGAGGLAIPPGVLSIADRMIE